MRLREVVAAVLVCAVGACATTIPVGRPPSPAEIARIEETAREGRALVLEYKPIVPLCSGGTCPSVGELLPESRADVNPLLAPTLSLKFPGGGQATVPMD